MSGTGPHGPERDVPSPRWPYDSPFAWAFPPPRRHRKRKRLPAFLAAIFPAARRHREHPPPAEPEPVRVFQPPEDNGWDFVSPAMMTRLDQMPARHRPYAGGRSLP